MSEAKHTPTPWAIVYGGLPGDDGFTIATNNAAAARVKMVCECWPCSIVDEQHREELAANARLLVDAPALLEALRDVYEVACGKRDMTLEESRRVSDLLEKHGEEELTDGEEKQTQTQPG